MSDFYPGRAAIGILDPESPGGWRARPIAEHGWPGTTGRRILEMCAHFGMFETQQMLVDLTPHDFSWRRIAARVYQPCEDGFWGVAESEFERQWDYHFDKGGWQRAAVYSLATPMIYRDRAHTPRWVDGSAGRYSAPVWLYLLNPDVERMRLFVHQVEPGARAGEPTRYHALGSFDPANLSARDLDLLRAHQPITITERGG